MIIYDVVVDEVFKGPAKRGDLIEVMQMSNEAGAVYLKEGDTYLLVLKIANGDPTGIMGGNQGQFRMTEAGFVAVDVNFPLKVTREQLDALR